MRCINKKNYIWRMRYQEDLSLTKHNPEGQRIQLWRHYTYRRDLTTYSAWQRTGTHMKKSSPSFIRVLPTTTPACQEPTTHSTAHLCTTKDGSILQAFRASRGTLKGDSRRLFLYARLITDRYLSTDDSWNGRVLWTDRYLITNMHRITKAKTPHECHLCPTAGT